MTPCWLWTRSGDRDGYGQVERRGKNLKAHRYVYELLIGPVPAGMQLDHICRARRCVNPEHLRVVTNRENLLAPGSKSPAKHNVEKTHCSKGHEFTPANTGRQGSGWRKCRKCASGYQKAYKARLSTMGDI